MNLHRFGTTFPRLFTAAIFQELSFMLLVYIPGYLTDLSATEGMIGILYSAAAVVSLLIRPWFGRVLDLTRRRTVLLIGGAINAVVILSLSLTSEWGAFLWGLFLVQRAVQIGLFTAMLTYGADAIPLERRTQGLAIFGLSGLIPIAVGGIAGDALIGNFGFDGLFVASAMFSIASWFVVWTFPTLPVRGAQPRRSFWAALAQPSLLPLWFVSLMFAVGLETLFTFARTFVEDRQVGTTGVIFAAYGTAAGLTRIAGGRLYDRLPHRPLLTGGIAVYGLGLVILALAQTVPMVVVAAVATGTAHGATFPLLSSEVINRARVNERGSAVSTLTAVFDVALLAGAPVVGATIDGFSYLVAFSAVGALLVVGSVLYWVWDRRIDPSTLVVEEVLE